MSLKEYQSQNNPSIKTASTPDLLSFVRGLKHKNIDFDVYLKSEGKNLQRGFIWSELRQQRIIESILLERPIPPISFIVEMENDKEKYLIIDGKQRITSIMNFLEGKFQIEINNKYYHFEELPKEFQTQILGYPIQGYSAKFQLEPYSDEAKREWFHFLNFGGVAQIEN
jgi:hypothetical protein